MQTDRYPIPEEGEARVEVPELECRFTYHAPKGNQLARYERIRAFAKDFAYALNQMCPESREKSRALDALDVCVMLANASIARNE